MCGDFSAREEQIGEPHSYADLSDKEPQILDAFEKTIADKVGNLHAPPEIAAQADRLVEIADQQRDVLAGLVAAAKKGDLAKVQRLLARNAASTCNRARLRVSSVPTRAASFARPPLARARRSAAASQAQDHQPCGSERPVT